MKSAKIEPIHVPASESLTQKAYRAIRQMLFHKELVPGQKIQYRDLAKKLGVKPYPGDSGVAMVGIPGPGAPGTEPGHVCRTFQHGRSD